ncbi:MAG: hypothetical protein O7G87_15685, partial [bacterium]|nr:hypothetical protein [bacterium]
MMGVPNGFMKGYKVGCRIGGVKANQKGRSLMAVTSDSQTAEILEQDRNHVWHPMLQHRVLEERDLMVIESAKGCTVVDGEGNEYLDGFGGLWN